MKKTIFRIGIFLVPTIVFGRSVTQNPTGDVGGLFTLFGSIVLQLIPIASMLVILFFFYGLSLFILKAGDPKAASEGKGIMVWGILALFVMVSIYGIIGFMQRSTGVDMPGVTNPIVLPSVVE